MTTSPDTTSPRERAEGIRWDLTPLAADAASARAHLDETIARAERFAQRYRGALATITAPELAAALAELAAIDNVLGRLGSYAHLREATDVRDSENRDLAASVDRKMVEAANALRFFELEWIALPAERAAELAGAPEVAADRHFLEAARRFAPHTLSEAEERMLAERSPAAVSAWQTLFGQVTSTLEIPFDAGDGETPHTIDRILAHTRDGRRDLRQRALETLYGALEPHAPILAHCYDTLIGDRLTLDRLRSYAGPMEQTHLRNEVSAEAIETMMVAVERNYPLAHRWFRAKAALLGLDRLELHDQYAPLGSARSVHYDEARGLVDGAFARFSRDIAAVAAEFFTERRVDAEPRPGKRGGAFCASVAQDASPYLLMNFTDRMDDVMTLAHELGHGMHFVLASREQTALTHHTGIALAEVPSTFAEMLTFDHLLESETDPATRRALIAQRVEGSFATIFRQTVLARYEQRAYDRRAAGETVTPERLGEIWMDQNARYYGDAVGLPEGYRYGWAYIPHFISTRFYTYAYVFAHLTALALYARYRERGVEFTPDYLTFLRAGGSGSPAELLAPLGVDLADPDVWAPGFAELERLVGLAEE